MPQRAIGDRLIRRSRLIGKSHLVLILVVISYQRNSPMAPSDIDRLMSGTPYVRYRLTSPYSDRLIEGPLLLLLRTCVPYESLLGIWDLVY